MHINLIWAEARNHVIGLGGTMPWHLPEDLAHLKRRTIGSTVIMGRKTWESIPLKFRPLPSRVNIVVSRQTDFLESQTGIDVQVATSLEAALDKASEYKPVWVIGGAQIYAQALPLTTSASKIVITQIDADYEGDAFAPTLGAEWYESERESHIAANGLPYAFVTFNKH